MKILLSPAKSLDFKSKTPTEKLTNFCFEEEAKYLNSILKNKSPKELSDLMSVSSKIADLNYERNNNWSTPFNLSNSRQAVYAFSGDVYKGLDVYSVAEDKLDFMQNSLRIISGLYGLLKPLDLIQPYRLEMGTKLQVDSNKNLYEFWDRKITKNIRDENSYESKSFYSVSSVRKPLIPTLRQKMTSKHQRNVVMWKNDVNSVNMRNQSIKFSELAVNV